MRFDDHRGMIPRLVRVGPSGLRATLVRTKTTGAGEKKEQLEIVVDRAAYLVEEAWLMAGWALWVKHDYPRDYFLCLPAPD